MFGLFAPESFHSTARYGVSFLFVPFCLVFRALVRHLPESFMFYKEIRPKVFHGFCVCTDLDLYAEYIRMQKTF